MADGGDIPREALIDRLATITGATSERARFYLEAAGWDLAVSYACELFSVSVQMYMHVSLSDIAYTYILC